MNYRDSKADVLEYRQEYGRMISRVFLVFGEMFGVGCSGIRCSWPK